MNLTIRGYSTALFCTWYFIEEAGVLFDAGDGVTTALAQKSRKIRHVFVSHADRDHITGLLQLIQLNGRGDAPAVYYPADSGSFPALEEFSKRFDPHINCPAWIPVKHGDVIGIGKNLRVRVHRNGHIRVAENIQKSLGFIIEETRRKLRPEWASMNGKDIATLRAEKPEDEITQEVSEKLLAYSGDTPPADPLQWQGVHTLLHEATFLYPEHIDHDPEARYNVHSLLDDVIAMVKQTDVRRLILGHFSSRYEDEEIEIAVKASIEKHALNIPVKIILPGREGKFLIVENRFV